MADAVLARAPEAENVGRPLLWLAAAAVAAAVAPFPIIPGAVGTEGTQGWARAHDVDKL